MTAHVLHMYIMHDYVIALYSFKTLHSPFKQSAVILEFGSTVLGIWQETRVAGYKAIA